MDTCDDINLLRGHGGRAPVYPGDRDSGSGRNIQRGDCHSECAIKGKEAPVHEGPQLVFFGYNNVLFVWGERNILL